MYKEIEQLSQLPSTKDAIKIFVEKIVEAVNNGEMNPLKLIVMLKKMDTVCDLIRKRISDQATNEAEKYGKTTEIDGAKIEIANVGVKYLYESCGDVEWEKLASEKKAIETRLKDREAILKAIKSDTEIYGSDGVKLNPPVRTGKESIKITLL